MAAKSQSRKPSLSEEQLELVAARFRIMGEPLRLRLLQDLQQGELSVGQLVDASGSTQANVSKHLQLLHRAGLVERRKEGLQVFYAIADPTVFRLCELVCDGLGKMLEEELRAARGRKR